MSAETASDVAVRIAEALERIAAQLEAREQDVDPDLFPVRPVTRRRKRDDDGQGR